MDSTKYRRIAPRLAFVDVETTGSAPDRARITEVAVVSVTWPDPWPGPPQVTTWQSLINPGTAIPPEIRFLTGIDEAMLRDAPPFSAVAGHIGQLLADAVFIAHHARFDYGFIKAEMSRAGHGFQARTLCTVRLSRGLDPDRSPHTLDALVLRWRLSCPDRHRALGDALALTRLLPAFFTAYGAQRVTDVASRLISRPNLPAHLNVQSLDAVPGSAGIYWFRGLNAHPLYIGKSANLRQRIASHFCTDYQSARGMRLASETRAVHWLRTPGEFSALLAEIIAIRRHMPAHNRALRHQSEAHFVVFEATDPKPRFARLADLTGQTPGGQLGPFASRAAARSCLVSLGRRHGWCLRAMGLERGHDGAPCFARQLGRCAGACVGEQTRETLAAQIALELDEKQIPHWPAAQLQIIERSVAGDEALCHCFDQWRWQQSHALPVDAVATDSPDLVPAATASWPALHDDESRQTPAIDFDRHVVDLLLRFIGREAFGSAVASPAARVRDAATTHSTALPSLAATHWQLRKHQRVSLHWRWAPRTPIVPALAGDAQDAGVAV